MNRRAGSDVRKIIGWTESAAAHKADAKGVATNTLSIDATRPDSIRLKVNGVLDVTIILSYLTIPFNGTIVTLRNMFGSIPAPTLRVRP